MVFLDDEVLGKVLEGLQEIALGSIFRASLIKRTGESQEPDMQSPLLIHYSLFYYPVLRIPLQPLDSSNGLPPPPTCNGLLVGKPLT